VNNISVHRRHFFFSTARTPFAERTATVTLVDMISNIGGTLGLFCGFSLLSGVEAIYWTLKGIKTKTLRKGKNKLWMA